MNTRLLKDEDWDTLCEWWKAWPGWESPPKSLLPDNGKGGLMVEKDGIPIIAGFIYLTNSDACLLEWIVSDPEYSYMDQNTLPIKIYFTLQNAPETLEEVNVILERIR